MQLVGYLYDIELLGHYLFMDVTWPCSTTFRWEQRCAFAVTDVEVDPLVN